MTRSAFCSLNHVERFFSIPRINGFVSLRHKGGSQHTPDLGIIIDNHNFT